MAHLRKPFVDPEFLQPGTGPNAGRWLCTLCHKNQWWTLTNAHRHESAQEHIIAVRHAKSKPAYSQPDPRVPNPRVAGLVAEPLQDILTDLHDRPYQSSDDDFFRFGSDIHMGDPATSPNSDHPMLDLPSDPVYLDPTQLEVNASRVAEDLHAILLSDSESDHSDDEEWEQLYEEDLVLPDEGPDQLNFGLERPRQSTKSLDNPDWFPWSDKETCVLDILRHLPRSLFSDSQMDIIQWGLAAFGVNNIPSTRTAKHVGEYLQSICGVKTERQEGPLGHIYYINELAGLIRQEMGDPIVRPHIRHFPEDSGQRLEHAWQAEAWKDMDPDLASPMIRKGSQHFYVYELASLNDGTLVIPFRWFTRARNPSALSGVSDNPQELFGLAWTVQMHREAGGYLVHQYDHIQFPAHQLLNSFPHLVETFQEDNIPDPRHILGTYTSSVSAGIEPWIHTTEDHGFANRWRIVANGHEVLTFAMWLYCDDTSGNVSKKWNKHNSFLFTAAGLPREHLHKESNIHYLCTSNLAPPLEMLDGIVTQIEQGQSNGIWVWDIQRQSMVLVIPAILAMLGDNPMQSEFACHVGLTGKFFCRCCMVKGRDAEDEVPAAQTGRRTPAGSRPASPDSTAAHSDDAASDAGSQSGKRQRRKETLQELIDRAQRFVGVNDDRQPHKTMDTLRAIFTTSSKIYGKTEAGKITTRTGVKDTFLEHFKEKVIHFIGKLPRGPSTEEKQKLVEEFVATEIPAGPSIFSPVFRIKGLFNSAFLNLAQLTSAYEIGFNPHRDTPVEILHVILLGFVKYFWRDAIARLSDEDKKKLTHRISSLDVSGMGISPLAGETLVKYAKSLTGRDFRAIAQVAPFVLYGLVPQECYDAWLSLSALVPLVWQPVIVDLEEYLKTLQLAIDRFLDCTAKWTPRWFNKPKFHVIKHLPMHIRRFGPAILYATEGFESFNAIIRDHSVHSNHKAPSRDIGRGFAQCSRIRHLLHGGVFLKPSVLRSSHPPPAIRTTTATAAESIPAPADLPPITTVPSVFSDDPKDWVTTGPLPLRLVNTSFRKTESPVIHAYGLEAPARNPDPPGHCIWSKGTRFNQPSSKLLLAKVFPSALEGPQQDKRYNLYQEAVSHMREHYKVGDYVVSASDASEAVYVGRVQEIIQMVGTQEEQNTRASAVLLQRYQTHQLAPKYKLPKLSFAHWTVVRPEDVLCVVNVQHNCAQNNCDLSDTRTVSQEQERTSLTKPRTRHYNPNDLLLNTNQMRSGVYVQRLRPIIPPINREEAIKAGAIRELESQMSTAQKSREALATRLARASVSTRTQLPVVPGSAVALGGSTRGARRCGNCNEIGHDRRTCPAPPRT